MPRDDRLRNAASWLAKLFVFTVSVAALGALFFFGLWSQTKSQLASDNRSHQYTISTYGPEYDRCVPLPGVAKAECIAKADEAYRQNTRDERDLVAQETTAAWTLVMSGAAIGGVILSIVGVFLIWGTFRETRQTNIIAREIGEAQTRAYLHVEKAELIQRAGDDDDGYVWQAILTIKNSGQSPARDVSLLIGGDGIDAASVMPRSISAGVSEELHVVGSTPREDLTFTDANETIWNFQAMVRVKFRDVFAGKEDFTSIDYAIFKQFVPVGSHERIPVHVAEVSQTPTKT